MVIFVLIMGVTLNKENNDRSEKRILPVSGEIILLYPRIGLWDSIIFTDIFYNITIRTINNTTNVTGHIYNITSKNESAPIFKEYNYSFVDEIWNPLLKALFDGRNYDPRISCDCYPEAPIKIIDKNGNLTIDGRYNSHKIWADVQGEKSRVWNNSIDETYNIFFEIFEDIKKDLSERYNISDEVDYYKSYDHDLVYY